VGGGLRGREEAREGWGDDGGKGLEEGRGEGGERMWED